MTPPDLLLLVLDTARADAFAPGSSPVRTPAIERLHAEGLSFRRAITPAPWTLPSHGSMFSGRLPTEHGITADALEWVDGHPSSPAPQVRAWHGPWVPDDLRARGYATMGISCNPWITGWGGFERGFDRFIGVRPWKRVPRGNMGWKSRRVRQILTKDHGGDRAAKTLVRWLSNAPAGRPLFAMVNLMEVHDPYDPPLRFHPLLRGEVGSSTGISRSRLPYVQVLQRGRLRVDPSREFLAGVRALYRASARYEDALVGRIVRAFAGRGRPAVVVLVSDHGEHLGEHGLFGHHSSLHEILLHVPLLFWGRGVDVGNGSVEESVSLTGLAGRIIAIADGSYEPLAPDGPVVSEYESTLKHMPATPREVETGETGPWLVRRPGVAIRDGSMKYLASDADDERLFDLAGDPEEEHDISAARPDEIARFRPFRDAWLARRAGATRETSSEEAGEAAEEEMAEHLRMLGYIE